MKSALVVLVVAQLTGAAFAADPLEAKPGDPSFAKFNPAKAPRPSGLVLKQGDQLAICGDSITEQKMYSRIIETYLTVCVSELEIAVRQYGWSGERAPGFLERMTNDCLRFKPTLVTTCYGMNDCEYRPYEASIGQTYREKSTAIVQSFKSHGARVIHGSPGCVGKLPGWVESANGTMEDLNLNLCNLRNIGIEIAAKENIGFADVFWPMFTAGFDAQQKYGTNYAIAGKDGVHPGWAGQLVMAYAFLKSFGLDGEIGTFSVDLALGKATASKGHELVSFKDGEMQIRSHRYPFCASGEFNDDNSICSGMKLIPFNEELNRLMLVVKNGNASRYKINWNAETKSFSADRLSKGVNLSEEFLINPFTEPFKKVDAAVAARQAYETRQVKDLFHGPEGETDMETTVALTEKVRAPLATAIREALVPVNHTLRITPE